MGGAKCRNSVFCVRFLFFFLIGTICGIWFYRCLGQSDAIWLRDYCLMLTGASGWSVILSVLRPLLPAALAWLHPYGRHAIPLLVGLRGMLTAYSACAVLRADLPGGPVLVRGLVILPIFYRLCRLAWDRRPWEASASERETIVTRKKVWFMC